MTDTTQFILVDGKVVRKVLSNHDTDLGSKDEALAYYDDLIEKTNKEIEEADNTIEVYQQHKEDLKIRKNLFKDFKNIIEAL